MNIRFCKCFALVLFLQVANLSPARSEENLPSGKIDPRVTEMIQKFSDYLKGLKTFSLNVSMNVKVDTEEFNTESFFALERPKKVAYIVKSGAVGSTILCNGTNLYVYVPSMRKYTEIKAPEKIESFPFSGENEGFPAAKIFSSPDPAREILRGVTEASFGDMEKVDGQECRHMKYTQNEIAWDLWMTTGEKPLIVKLVPDLGKMLRDVAGQKGDETDEIVKKMKYDVSVTFKDWNTDKKIAEGTFEFIVPPGVEKVESLMSSSSEKKESSTDERSLVDSDAPQFELNTIDGNKFSIAEHKGKNIVILDFWATWCPPCRKALPIFARLAEEFKGKGVVFCAVNQAEAQNDVIKFLKNAKINCLVALDSDSKVGILYGADSIPRTIVIGRNGIVKAVHVGFSPGYEKVIKEDITKLMEDSAVENGSPADSTAKPEERR